MKTGGLIVVGIVGLILGVGIMNAKNRPPYPPKGQQENTSTYEAVSTPEKCRDVDEKLARIVRNNEEAMNNPKPGLFYITARYWTGLDGGARDGLVRALAVQKGCQENGDPLYTSIEIRSIADDRILASGTVWNYKGASD